MALFYPVTTPRSSLGSAQALRSSAQGNAAHKTQKPAAEWHGGRTAVERFFRPTDDKGGPGWQKGEDPSQKATLRFMIVTVPDPVDSGLPHVYDRYMAAIEAAVQSQPYYLSRFDLPWEDCLSGGKDNDNKESGADEDNQQADDTEQPGKPCKERRFAKEPGFLLLNNPTGKTPAEEKESDKSKIDLLLVYLVGETPAAGIQKRALIAALNEISWFCGWKESTDPTAQTIRSIARNCPGDDAEVRMLGPSYSGSAQSIDLALSYWLDSISIPVKPAVTLISGSATAIKNPYDPRKSDFYNVRSRLRSRFSFRSMEIPDSVAQSEFCKYLKANAGPDKPIKVAILSESGTVYGHQEIPEASKTRVLKAPDPKSECEVGIDQTTLPYPSHISQLRAVSEKLRQAQQQATPQAQTSSKTLPLAESLEDAGLRRDVQTFSPASAVTAEQVMANLLSTISREHYNYVGILATDSRDIMFLAQEVREHSPATVLFTFGPDLLFLHPEINQTLRGMLIVTSYPLTNSNQLWSVPSHPEARLQFPDDGTEGVYNATLALLRDDKDMVEFSPPFKEVTKASGQTGPPVWITVVGRDRLLPVTAYDVSSDSSVQSYTYGLAADRIKSIDKSAWLRGLYSEPSVFFVTAFSVLCIVFSQPLLKRSHRPADPQEVPQEVPHKVPQKDGGLTLEPSPSHLDSAGHAPVKHAGTVGPSVVTITAWLDRILGEADSEEHRRPGALCLLAGCASLGTFLLVLGTALFIPVQTMGKLGARGRPFWIGIALVVICALGLISLVQGSVALVISIWKKRPRRKKAPHAPPDTSQPTPGRSKLNFRAWGPITVGSSATILLALFLSWTWISQMRDGDFLSVLFTSLRSLDLVSGVSALVPLFLISVAGFVWAVGSFQRIRQLDALDGKGGTSVLWRFELSDEGQQEQLSHYLKCSSLTLPGTYLVSLFAVISGVYLWTHLVHSLEQGLFYWLLTVSFSFVSLAIWHAVLRFCLIWQQTQRLLKHLSLGPLRAACKRFRNSFPALPKIDLASSAAALAHLECSVAQARTLLVQVKPLVEAGDVQLKVSGGRALTVTNVPQSDALHQMKEQVDEAATQLGLARKAHHNGDWRTFLNSQCASREALSNVAAEVAGLLQDSWWTELREPSSDPSDAATANREKVFRLAEDFLAGRLAHFLACVFPHMQNLIFTSVAGLLLLLFAVSSYPFQPHNVLLLFNWVIILSVVGIALWVFIQMSRDPILSHLNGTKPGQISWNGEFVFRIFTYGIVPILALLGAQFPQTVGQILSRLVAGEGGHP